MCDVLRAEAETAFCILQSTAVLPLVFCSGCSGGHRSRRLLLQAENSSILLKVRTLWRGSQDGRLGGSGVVEIGGSDRAMNKCSRFYSLVRIQSRGFADSATSSKVFSAAKLNPGIPANNSLEDSISKEKIVERTKCHLT